MGCKLIRVDELLREFHITDEPYDTKSGVPSSVHDATSMYDLHVMTCLDKN